MMSAQRGDSRVFVSYHREIDASGTTREQVGNVLPGTRPTTYASSGAQTSGSVYYVGYPMPAAATMPPTGQSPAAEGAEYFFNHATGTSTWYRPPELGGPPAPMTAPAAAAQPAYIPQQAVPQTYAYDHAEATRQRAAEIAKMLAAQGATVPVGPGAPIQTGPQATGPPGANLFIFHIPNDCMNVHLYELFKPYGHLLSARIMVDKRTGRGRGFGFVSYASADQAYSAIKALNGFQIGHKRLAVSVKRSKDEVARFGPAAGAAAAHYYQQQQQQQQFYVPGATHGGVVASAGMVATGSAGMQVPGQVQAFHPHMHAAPSLQAQATYMQQQQQQQPRQQRRTSDGLFRPDGAPEALARLGIGSGAPQIPQGYMVVPGLEGPTALRVAPGAGVPKLGASSGVMPGSPRGMTAAPAFGGAAVHGGAGMGGGVPLSPSMMGGGGAAGLFGPNGGVYPGMYPMGMQYGTTTPAHSPHMAVSQSAPASGATSATASGALMSSTAGTASSGGAQTSYGYVTGASSPALQAQHMMMLTGMGGLAAGVPFGGMGGSPHAGPMAMPMGGMGIGMGMGMGMGAGLGLGGTMAGAGAGGIPSSVGGAPQVPVTPGGVAAAMLSGHKAGAAQFGSAIGEWRQEAPLSPLRARAVSDLPSPADEVALPGPAVGEGAGDLAAGAESGNGGRLSSPLGQGDGRGSFLRGGGAGAGAGAGAGGNRVARSVGSAEAAFFTRPAPGSVGRASDRGSSVHSVRSSNSLADQSDVRAAANPGHEN